MIKQYPQFFTATILKWRRLLAPEKYKFIIIESLKFLVENERVILYCFVIMPNHIHLIWQMKGDTKASDVQRDFLKYTAQQIKFDLIKSRPEFLMKFKVDAKDREFQIWKYRSLSKTVRNAEIFKQKLKYIHNNPLQKHWKLADKPENYSYSSARFYLMHDNTFGFLSHYQG